MKPDIYLSGEKSEDIKYKVPENFENFFKKRDLFLVFMILLTALIITEVII